MTVNISPLMWTWCYGSSDNAIRIVQKEDALLPCPMQTDQESAVWVWEHQAEPATSPGLSPFTTLKPWPGNNFSSVLTTQKTKIPCGPNALEGLLSPLAPNSRYTFIHHLLSQKIIPCLITPNQFQPPLLSGGLKYTFSTKSEPLPSLSFHGDHIIKKEKKWYDHLKIKISIW